MTKLLILSFIFIGCETKNEDEDMLKFLKKKPEPKVAETPEPSPKPEPTETSEPKPTITWEQIEKEVNAAHDEHLMEWDRRIATKVLKEKGLLIHKDQLKREDEDRYSEAQTERRIGEAVDRIVKGKTSLTKNEKLAQEIEKINNDFQKMGEALGYTFPEGPPTYPTMIQILSTRVIELMARVKALEEKEQPK